MQIKIKSYSFEAYSKIKIKIMKKLLSIVAVAAVMAACNDSSTKVDSTSTDSTKMSNDAMKTDTSATMTPAATDTSTAMNSSAMVKDGMMTMKDGKMMVMKNGSWEEMKEEMTCTNGCKVKPNGEVTKGDKKKTLTEGMMIDKDGQMVDASGKLVDETAWK